MKIRYAMAGAAGRMGRRIIALAAEDARFELAAALEPAGSAALGRDAGELAGIARTGVPVTDTLQGAFDVLIDFSTPAGTAHWLEVCQREGRAMVIGTTGHDAALGKGISQAVARIPVLKSANMSVGVNVLLRVVEQLSEVLDATYDVEIVEAHHRFKIDAPSGTALALRDAVQKGRSVLGGPAPTVVHGRQGQTGQRPTGEIGMHALRMGDTVGEHTVYFGNLGETIHVGHSAHSRDTFAAGALRAAAWLSGRGAGLYDMKDVLFGNA